MGKETGRRKFLKNFGVGSLAAGIAPVALFEPVKEDKPANETPVGDSPAAYTAKRVYNSSYTGENLNRIAFPIGGIGAGMFCIEGAGSISHMSIRNRPELLNNPGIYAAISIKGIKNGAKLLEGPVPDWKKFGQPGAGNGLGGATTGLPHFKKAVFKARFPFAVIDLTDDDLPVQVQLTGWSPFIPSDDDNSSLPVGAFEYRIKNTGAASIDAVFSFNAKNFLQEWKGKNAISKIDNGFVLSEAGTAEKSFLKSDFAFFTDDPATIVNHCWFRGGWWDGFTMAWNAVQNAEAKAVESIEESAPGASVYVPFSLAPGKEKTIRLHMAWYTPDSDQVHGTIGEPKKNCSPENGCCNSPADLQLDKYDKNYTGKFHKPWYSNRFANIREVCDYWRKQYADLHSKSDAFTRAFFSSTLPPEIIEAVAANLSILKSTTVLRQYDGRLWNFEGSADNWGSSHGSCTHVWNYAQAFAHLFPALERSLRASEFCESQDEKGHQNFRTNLPITPTVHDFHAAADGQLGGIMKVYRDWRISGDNGWMERIYPMVKKSLDYCIETWDPQHKGVIEEPHHNTYDIEFWGPDGMHSSFYIGALAAFVEIGKHFKKDTSAYEALLAKGKKYMENELFNGEYFIQQIKTSGLKAKDPATEKSYGGNYSPEAMALLQKEGPKYQYGAGCLSDGVLGAWIAAVCGLHGLIDDKKITSHLLAIHKYNLKNDLSKHANPQRPSYALGSDGGLLLCSWPKGGKLSLPFVYSDEVWTGIEHQVAAHLLLMGKIKEGLEIVRACRDRYDGHIRNPFDEYEWGNWYGRALASYGYLQCLTGVRFDAVEKKLYVDSKIGDFTSFLSTETGFGTVTLKQGKVTWKAYYGTLPIDKVILAKTA